MSDLLDSVIAAQGGWDRWTKVKSITVDASNHRGSLGHKASWCPAQWRAIRCGYHSRVLRLDFIGKDKRSVFELHRVVIEHNDGALIDGRDDPEKSFDGHHFETPWDDIHLACFLGEALWMYLNITVLHKWARFASGW